MLGAIAMVLSLLGALGNLAYGFANPMPALPEAMAMMSYMPWVIVLIAAVLAAYAWTMGKKGVLS